MRIVPLALAGMTAAGLLASIPVQAQTLNDVGRALIGRPNQERDAYERGRQDQERLAREDEARRREVGPGRDNGRRDEGRRGERRLEDNDRDRGRGPPARY